MLRHAQTLTLFCALLTLCAASYAKDDGHDKDHAAIIADCILADTAAESKDANGMTAFLAPDFIEVNQGGAEDIHSRSEVLKIWT